MTVTGKMNWVKLEKMTIMMIIIIIITSPWNNNKQSDRLMVKYTVENTCRGNHLYKKTCQMIKGSLVMSVIAVIDYIYTIVMLATKTIRL